VMAELILRDAPFRGQTEIEQIDKIFKLLGVPDDFSWPGYSKLKYVQKFQFLGENKNKLREKFPEEILSQAGYELLKGLLTLDPKQRLTAKAALKSSWFKENPKSKPVCE
jgi:cell division cycle 2-like